MTIYLSVDIARVVLGYLKEESYMNTYWAFLEECQHLSEYLAKLELGIECPTLLNGHSLRQIIDIYAASLSGKSLGGVASAHSSLSQPCGSRSHKSSAPPQHVSAGFKQQVSKQRTFARKNNQVISDSHKFLPPGQVLALSVETGKTTCAPAHQPRPLQRSRYPASSAAGHPGIHSARPPLTSVADSNNASLNTSHRKERWNRTPANHSPEPDGREDALHSFDAGDDLGMPGYESSGHAGRHGGRLPSHSTSTPAESAANTHAALASGRVSPTSSFLSPSKSMADSDRLSAANKTPRRKGRQPRKRSLDGPQRRKISFDMQQKSAAGDVPSRASNSDSNSKEDGNVMKDASKMLEDILLNLNDAGFEGMLASAVASNINKATCDDVTRLHRSGTSLTGGDRGSDIFKQLQCTSSRGGTPAVSRDNTFNTTPQPQSLTGGGALTPGGNEMATATPGGNEMATNTTSLAPLNMAEVHDLDTMQPCNDIDNVDHDVMADIIQLTTADPIFDGLFSSFKTDKQTFLEKEFGVSVAAQSTAPACPVSSGGDERTASWVSTHADQVLDAAANSQVDPANDPALSPSSLVAGRDIPVSCTTSHAAICESSAKPTRATSECHKTNQTTVGVDSPAPFTSPSVPSLPNHTVECSVLKTNTSAADYTPKLETLAPATCQSDETSALSKDSIPSVPPDANCPLTCVSNAPGRPAMPTSLVTKEDEIPSTPASPVTEGFERPLTPTSQVTEGFEPGADSCGTSMASPFHQKSPSSVQPGAAAAELTNESTGYHTVEIIHSPLADGQQLVEKVRVRVTDLQGFRVVNATTTETRTKDLLAGGDEASNSCTGVNGMASVGQQQRDQVEPATGASMPDEEEPSVSTAGLTRITSSSSPYSTQRAVASILVDKTASATKTNVSASISPHSSSAAPIDYTAPSPATQAAIASILVTDSPSSPDVQLSVSQSTASPLAQSSPVVIDNVEQSSHMERAVSSIPPRDPTQSTVARSPLTIIDSPASPALTTADQQPNPDNISPGSEKENALKKTPSKRSKLLVGNATPVTTPNRGRSRLKLKRGARAKSESTTKRASPVKPQPTMVSTYASSIAIVGEAKVPKNPGPPPRRIIPTLLEVGSANSRSKSCSDVETAPRRIKPTQVDSQEESNWPPRRAVVRMGLQSPSYASLHDSSNSRTPSHPFTQDSNHGHTPSHTCTQDSNHSRTPSHALSQDSSQGRTLSQTLTQDSNHSQTFHPGPTPASHHQDSNSHGMTLRGRRNSGHGSHCQTADHNSVAAEVGEKSGVQAECNAATPDESEPPRISSSGCNAVRQSKTSGKLDMQSDGVSLAHEDPKFATSKDSAELGDASKLDTPNLRSRRTSIDSRSPAAKSSRSNSIESLESGPDTGRRLRPRTTRSCQDIVKVTPPPEPKNDKKTKKKTPAEQKVDKKAKSRRMENIINRVVSDILESRKVKEIKREYGTVRETVRPAANTTAEKTHNDKHEDKSENTKQVKNAKKQTKSAKQKDKKDGDLKQSRGCGGGGGGGGSSSGCGGDGPCVSSISPNAVSDNPQVLKALLGNDNPTRMTLRKRLNNLSEFGTDPFESDGGTVPETMEVDTGQKKQAQKHSAGRKTKPASRARGKKSSVRNSAPSEAVSVSAGLSMVHAETTHVRALNFGTTNVTSAATGGGATADIVSGLASSGALQPGFNVIKSGSEVVSGIVIPLSNLMPTPGLASPSAPLVLPTIPAPPAVTAMEMPLAAAVETEARIASVNEKREQSVKVTQSAANVRSTVDVSHPDCPSGAGDDQEKEVTAVHTVSATTETHLHSAALPDITTNHDATLDANTHDISMATNSILSAANFFSLDSNSKYSFFGDVTRFSQFNDTTDVDMAEALLALSEPKQQSKESPSFRVPFPVSSKPDTSSTTPSISSIRNAITQEKLAGKSSVTSPTKVSVSSAGEFAPDIKATTPTKNVIGDRADVTSEVEASSQFSSPLRKSIVSSLTQSMLVDSSQSPSRSHSALPGGLPRTPTNRIKRGISSPARSPVLDRLLESAVQERQLLGQLVPTSTTSTHQLTKPTQAHLPDAALNISSPSRLHALANLAMAVQAADKPDSKEATTDQGQSSVAVPKLNDAKPAAKAKHGSHSVKRKRHAEEDSRPKKKKKVEKSIKNIDLDSLLEKVHAKCRK